jgi:Flp pilus assembly protein TadB
MAEPTPVAKPSTEEVAEQLAKTTADLRTLGEQLGAIPHASSRVMTLRRARIIFLLVVVVAMLVGWFLWEQWHSLLAAFAPLVWIVGHSLRWRRRRRSFDETHDVGGT